MSDTPSMTADMVEVFRGAATQQIADLDRSLSDLCGAPEHWADRKEKLRGIAHNLKGQGASFGYPLITAVAQSLLNLLRGLDGADITSMKVAAAHARVLRTILDKDIRGSGGSQGDELVRRLQLLSAKCARGFRAR